MYNYNPHVATAPDIEHQYRISNATSLRIIIIILIMVIIGFLIHYFVFVRDENVELRNKIYEYAELIKLNSDKAFNYDGQANRTTKFEEENKKLYTELGKHQNEIDNKNLQLQQVKLKLEKCINATSNADHNKINQFLIAVPTAMIFLLLN